MSTDPSRDRPLDIGVFGVRDIPSTYSGFETFLNELLPELAERGHRVTIYTRGEIGRRASHRGVERRGTRAVRSKQLDTLTHSWTAGFAAWRGRHDVALVCNVANALALLAYRPLGVRAVLNVDGQEWVRGKWGRVGRAYFRGSAHVARFAAVALVADCQAMADVYRDEFRSDATVIPYSSPPLRLDDEAIDDALASFGVERDGFVFTGGRLVPENNIERIVGRYVGTDHPFPILVAGAANYDSPVQHELDRLASIDPRVRLVGHVGDRVAFASLLAGARAYVHGHSVGGINPSMVEALAVGANILALDTPFNREAMGDAGSVFRLDGSFEAALDGAIAEAAAPARRDTARARAAGRFSLTDVADAYERLLRAAASGDRRPLTTIWSRSSEEPLSADPG